MMPRTRSFGATFLAVLVTLGLTARALDQAATQARHRAGAEVRSRSDVAQAAPEQLGDGHDDRRRDRRTGSRVDRASRDTLSATEVAAAQNPPTGTCCKRAPPILEFDAGRHAAAIVGRPGAGLRVAGVESRPRRRSQRHHLDGRQRRRRLAGAEVHAGRQVRGAVRRSGQNKGSNDPENFGRPAKIFVDPRENEAYIADGYLNKRVVVIDADTGKFKRYWGAYGKKPDDTNLGPYDPNAPAAKQFRTPVHCSDLSMDNFVYVCDRPNNRLQVFTREGKFVKEAFFVKKTLGDGAVWDVAFSKDPQQTYLYMADGKNERVNILLRDTLELLSSFGDGGRQPGQFFAVHSIVTDSKGNLYTTETYEGRRVQKFVFKGVAAVPRHQGVVWPGK